MGVAFKRGQVLGPTDLDIHLTNEAGFPTNAASISYAIYHVQNGLEYLLGDARRVPVNGGVGQYHAAFMIPSDAPLGDYVVRWTVKQFVNTPEVMVLQEFAVVSDTTLVSSAFDANVLAMINSMRIRCRDNNPDRNYRFRPPMGEGAIAAQNRVFGQIWEDAEIAEYLDRGLDLINMWPPATFIPSVSTLVSGKPSWRTLLLEGAVMQALFALTANWCEEDFSYSIGGISLDLDKSSKYQSLLDNAQNQWDKYIEAAKRTVKITLGLRQSRFGYGIRSAFGPTVGGSVMTPRNFVHMF